MAFHWSQPISLISRTIRSNLAGHNNAIVWKVSTRSLIIKSFCDFSLESLQVRLVSASLLFSTIIIIIIVIIILLIRVFHIS